MTSKQGYGPDLRKYLDKRLHVRLNAKRSVTGQMIGYDHFMNIVLDKAVEHIGKQEKEIGKAMIRGNSILMWECLDKPQLNPPTPKTQIDQIESEIGLNIMKKIPPVNEYFNNSKDFQTSSYMKKIKDNISNHSKTSRDYSSLLSSSNDSESEKNLQKTLGNFSESYIKTLSKKINERASEKMPAEKILQETHTAADKVDENQPILKKVRSDPAFNTNQKINESPLGRVDGEKNPLINQMLLGSGETTKKEPSVYENENEEDKAEAIKNSRNKPLNILKMIKHVSVAINKLRNRTQYRTLKFVSDEQTDMINDATWFSERQGKNNDHMKMLLAESPVVKSFYKIKISMKKTLVYRTMSKGLKYFKANFFSKVGVIEPDHKLKMVFDFMIIILIMFLFFLFPLQMSFDFYLVENIFPGNTRAQEIIYFLIITLLSMDIILKFFTGYYENGISVLQKDKIFRNYVKNHLFFDVVAFLPVFLISFRQTDFGGFGLEKYNSFVKLSEFLIFFKVFEVVKALQTLEEMLHMNEQTEALFELFKLITKILLFCHILACCWHAVAYYSPYHNTIISEDVELEHANWLTKYLYFLYWTISIEKIEPRNNLELFFGFFALLGSEAVMGIIIEGIHSIIESLTRAGTERRDSIRVINRYMMRKNIEYDIQVKVRKYLNFIYDQDSANAARENELIEKLSGSLREEILIRANGNILKMVPMFYKNFTEITLRKLVFSMKQVRFYPEEIIFQVLETFFNFAKGEKENDSDDRSIFLISDGEIEMFKETGNGNRLCIKKLKEKFRMLSDKIINYQSYEDLYIKCPACKRVDHTIDRCPFLHFVPQKEFLICRHLFNKPTLQREPHSRRDKRTINSRKKIGDITRKMKEFLSSLNLEQESGDEFSESDSSEDDDNFESSGSGVVNSMTKINSAHKKVSMVAEPLPSSGVIRNPGKELSSVIELDKDEDETKEISAHSKSIEKKVTSANDQDGDLQVGVIPHHPKRTTIRTGYERETTFKHDKTGVEREVSRKYSVYPDSMVMEGKTAFSRGDRERTTKIQSGVYPPTSILQENKNDMYLKEMDKMTIFSFYFPYNNSDNVIRNLHYKRLARRSTKYAKVTKANKASRKTRKSTKNLAKELSNLGLGLAIRMPSINSEAKDPSFLDNNGYSPHKSLRPKKSFFTENDEQPKKDDPKK